MTAAGLDGAVGQEKSLRIPRMTIEGERFGTGKSTWCNEVLPAGLPNYVEFLGDGRLHLVLGADDHQVEGAPTSNGVIQSAAHDLLAGSVRVGPSASRTLETSEGRRATDPAPRSWRPRWRDPTSHEQGAWQATEPIDRSKLVLVTGAGGFIGGHLVGDLLASGVKRVRAVDCKPMRKWFQRFEAAVSRQLNLMDQAACANAVREVAYVFNPAADMGGMRISSKTTRPPACSADQHAHAAGGARGRVEGFFFASSACVYPAEKQRDTHVTALQEADAYPAQPEDDYEWEKLFSERMCRHFNEDFGLATRVARYHNVYGHQRYLQRWAGEGAGGDLP